jgi:hypothetical protein
VRGGPGYVAAGTVQTQPSPTPENYRAALWFSSDGAHWQPASDAGPGFGAAFFNDVVAGGPGLVAVGFAYPADGTLPVPASWTSGDGKSWRRLPLGAALGKSAGIDRVVAGRNELLALGHEAPTGLEHQIVWTSHDGLHWRRAATDPFSVGHSPPAITTLGSGFAAVGEFGNAPALWSSPDGSRWMAEAGSDIFGGGFTMLVDGAPWRNGLLVIGRRGSPPVITSSPGAQGVVFEPVAWLWTYGRGPE